MKSLVIPIVLFALVSVMNARIDRSSEDFELNVIRDDSEVETIAIEIKDRDERPSGGMGGGFFSKLVRGKSKVFTDSKPVKSAGK